MRITVGTTPIAIVAANEGTRSVVGRHRGTDPIYIDTNTSPDSSSGFQIDPGDNFAMDCLPSDVLYAVSDAPGQRVDVMKASA